MTDPDTTPTITGEEIAELEWCIQAARDGFEHLTTHLSVRGASDPWRRAIARMKKLAVARLPALLAEARSAVTLRQQLQAVQAENAEMREALKPVADWSKRLDLAFSDHDDDTIASGCSGAYITFGDVRRAARLTSPPAPEDGG